MKTAINKLNKNEIQLLENRWIDYLKNIKAVEHWDDVKKELKKKLEKIKAV